MSELARKRCKPCREGTPPLSRDVVAALLADLDGWQVTEQPRLRKLWKLADFQSALALVNRIGEIAEAEDHHPDITLSWGRVGVELWTHTVNGLSENDFILAAKIDEAQSR